MWDPSPEAVQASGTLLAGGDREKPLTADLSCFKSCTPAIESNNSVVNT